MRKIFFFTLLALSIIFFASLVISAEFGYNAIDTFSFLDLNDVPVSYVGSADDCLAVNPGETGIIFANCGGLINESIANLISSQIANDTYLKISNYGNPFDQDLNTTNDVFFNALNLSTSSGDTRLSIGSVDQSDGFLDFFNTGTGVIGANLWWDESAVDLHIRNLITGSNTDLIFETGTTGEAMRIKGTGNVGIGTASPLGKLTINGTAFDDNPFGNYGGLVLTSEQTTGCAGCNGTGIEWTRIGDLGAKKAAIYPYQVGSDVDTLGLAFDVSPDAGAANPIIRALTLESGGNVGIKTKDPDNDASLTIQGNLTIYDDAGNNGFKMYVNSDGDLVIE